ncbi:MULTISPECIES: hypothetical protein [unclassified Mycobacterium]|uniref:hypothetical protein n=1 Tax=unclassified Mycobacterium TaxID=2642494 RepID=UPI00073FC59C|nr:MULTISPECIES: hypothetical protein [unclassified Mycobacterium]KUH82205.1 hypothetical protein AU185_21145 [Mycobacterium sp. GA-0227b]KUH90061.1 hypothetical protein AU186_10285 [Mycobacterium sp. GA-1999]
MAGRNPTAAVKAFIAPISDALGLFASGRVTADSYKPAVEGVLTFNDGKIVKLLGNKVGLSVSMRYRIVQTDDPGRGPWKVTTVGYMYELQLDGKTLYDYHWHPISASHEVRPHLHCSAVGKGHIPTGRVMIEDVLNLAVHHGAKPRNATQWNTLDKLNREKFARGATWGIGPS